MKSQDVWELYQRGVEHHSNENMYEDTKRNYNFYIGDQWNGCKTGNEELPVLNFIKPVCRYKISMIAQNQVGIVYNDLSPQGENGSVCTALTAFAATMWEQSKMDSLAWEIIKNACIGGDHYLYCYNAESQGAVSEGGNKAKIRMRGIHRCNLYLSDEQNPSMEEQEYIIIAERLAVSRVRAIAKKNGIPQKEIEEIRANEESSQTMVETSGCEVKSDLGKCTSILFMRKTPKGVEFCRSVEQVVYEPMKLIPGLDRYPIAALRWETVPGTARGMGAVKHMISNQLEVNKTAARRAVVIKKFAFPVMVYDNKRVPEPEKLSTAGALVGVDNLENMPMGAIIQYINPAPLSPDAERLQNELMIRTKELEGAGDAAMGQVDPTKASGEAIKAVRDQAAVTLNEQISGYRQFVEDMAMIWFKMWVAYNPQGITLSYVKNGATTTQTISPKALTRLEPQIRIDISPVDPYSKLSQEIAMERLLQLGHITFEEYVEALSGNSSVPKNKLQEILKRREPQGQNPQRRGLPPIEALEIQGILNKTQIQVKQEGGDMDEVQGV